VTSSICAGAVAAIDAMQALRVAGVVQVLTHESVQSSQQPLCAGGAVVLPVARRSRHV